MEKPASVQALVDLGFTELEADVYSFLLTESPATGYRVSQATGRLPANVYKALETLQAKGAVLIDEGASRMCSPAPPSELLSMLRRRYTDREARAERALADLRTTTDDDRVYQLRSREQVMERCRTMLERCKKVAVLDLFPQPLAELKGDLEALAARGVEVTVKTFHPTKMKGVTTVTTPNGDKAAETYPGQWIFLVADGAEMLLASLAEDGRRLHQAIYTSSVALAYFVHAWISSEMMLCMLLEEIDRSEDADQIKAAARTILHPNEDVETTGLQGDLLRFKHIYNKGVPGYDALVEMIGLRTSQEPIPV